MAKTGQNYIVGPFVGLAVALPNRDSASGGCPWMSAPGLIGSTGEGEATSMANCACGGVLKVCSKCGTILCGHSNQGGECKKGTPHPVAGTCPRCRGTVTNA